MGGPGINVSVADDVSQVGSRQSTKAPEVASDKPASPPVGYARPDYPGYPRICCLKHSGYGIRDGPAAYQRRGTVEQTAHVKGLSGDGNGSRIAVGAHAPQALVHLLA